MSDHKRNRSESFDPLSTEVWSEINHLDSDDLAALDDCLIPGSSDQEFREIIEEKCSLLPEITQATSLRNAKRLKSTEDFASLVDDYAFDVSPSTKDDVSIVLDLNTDVSVLSDLNTDTASVQSTPLVSMMNPVELDQHLEQSMSRLALSMQRSETSRRKVIENGSAYSSSNPFGLSIVLGDASSKRGQVITSGRAQLKSYMSQIGKTI